MINQQNRLKTNLEMKPYKSEFSFISFLKNYFTIASMIRKNKKEFKHFAITKVAFDDKKKDFEEKQLKGFKMSNFNEWAGTSVSQSPMRLLRIDTTSFLKHLLTKLKKTNPSYEIFNKLLYHFYYKYSFFGCVTIFSVPFSFLAVNKNFQRFGIFRFLPLLILASFTSVFASNFGDIGVIRNSLLLLFILESKLSNDDDELKGYVEEYLKEKNFKFKNMVENIDGKN